MGLDEFLPNVRVVLYFSKTTSVLDGDDDQGYNYASLKELDSQRVEEFIKQFGPMTFGLQWDGQVYARSTQHRVTASVIQGDLAGAVEDSFWHLWAAHLAAEEDVDHGAL